jgi:hypothetical protein
VIVELKALSETGGIEEAQILNYLKATGLETGLLLNFGTSSLEDRRFVRSSRAAADVVAENQAASANSGATHAIT